MKPSEFDIGETSFNRGIERESLRVTSNGELALTPHPSALGAKLTHPKITTDFSESQLELITPVFTSVDDVLAELARIHQYVHHSLDGELLWPASMPCLLPSDSKIPLADYGNSNVALHKKTYRSGLGIRYGRSMQTISAVHYNFSPDDTIFTQLAAADKTPNTTPYRNERYYGLMRNFRDLSWLPVYLFGASPAITSSFAKAAAHDLIQLDEGTLYSPHATSLRNGDLGYQSETQNGLMDVCYNGIESYIAAIARGTTTPHEPYVHLNTDPSSILQLNSNLLQSEAEFYTSIRAKCIPEANENFLNALARRGVEYVEVRLLDLNPFSTLGIDADALRFLDLLLTFCLFSDSRIHPPTRCLAVTENLQRVVRQGRDSPDKLLLNAPSGARSLSAWGTKVMDALEPWAQQFGEHYVSSLKQQREKLREPARTPSAEMLTRMVDQRIGFVEFGTELARQQHDSIRSPDPDTLSEFKADAEYSLTQLVDREALEEAPFATFLANLNAEYEDIRTSLADTTS